MEWDEQRYPFPNLGPRMPEGRTPKAENRKGRGEEWGEEEEEWERMDEEDETGERGLGVIRFSLRIVMDNLKSLKSKSGFITQS